MRKNFEFRLTMASLEASLPADEACGNGATVEFLGLVRPEENGERIAALEYEVYPEMAQKLGDRLVSEVSQRHGILGMEVVHRMGRVPVGEVSLRVRVHGKHRRETFAACAECIERLKQDVPIWKKARK